MFSVFVNSTDSFEDCWYPFFYLFNKFCPDYKGKIYLNTETKAFSFPDLNIISIKNNIENPNKLVTWSQCLMRAIDIIETDIILYLQEDYFIKYYVDFKQILEFVNLMEKENVSCIHLTSYGPHGPYLSTPYKKLSLVDQKAPYRISTQASLWKKEVLKKYLRPHENAWQFEIFGTKRSHKKKDYFYCINNQTLNDGREIIPYQPTGIINGKWNKKAIFELFRDNQIKVNFEKRGFYNPQINRQKQKITLIKIINRFKSYF